MTAVQLLLLALVPDWGSPVAAEPVSTVASFLGVLSSGLSIALAVVFCIWLYRVLADARLRHPMAEIQAGWAVGSFFIPIVHLFAPYYAIRRGWQADVSEDTGALAAWFVPWSLSVAMSYVSGFLGASIAFRYAVEAVDSDAPDLGGLWEELRPTLLVVSAVSLVLQALAAFFLVRVVRRWTALQEGRPVS